MWLFRSLRQGREEGSLREAKGGVSLDSHARSWVWPRLRHDLIGPGVSTRWPGIGELAPGLHRARNGLHGAPMVRGQHRGALASTTYVRGLSQERESTRASPALLKALSVLSTSFCFGLGRRPSGSHKPVSLRNMLNHHEDRASSSTSSSHVKKR